MKQTNYGKIAVVSTVYPIFLLTMSILFMLQKNMQANVYCGLFLVLLLLAQSPDDAGALPGRVITHYCNIYYAVLCNNVQTHCALHVADQNNKRW